MILFDIGAGRVIRGRIAVLISNFRSLRSIAASLSRRPAGQTGAAAQVSMDLVGRYIREIARLIDVTAMYFTSDVGLMSSRRTKATGNPSGRGFRFDLHHETRIREAGDK
jgi:hypothetical protein